ncbi:MAG: hypothetical protein FWC50_08515, partial [Planctomycetaceae bacterium]|nr:hypothetical protein [Planctomycetaceae bacterium]
QIQRNQMQNHLSTSEPNTRMTQINVPDQTEPEVELLVAYLDGELDSDTVRAVETRLSQEPLLREKMTAFEQTWNVLGSLETVPVDKTLVRTTMEVVTSTIEHELRADEEKIEKRKMIDRGLLIAVIVMFGVIGYQLTSFWGIKVNEQILNDIPVIEQMGYYKEIDDIDFLRALAERGLFSPAPQTSQSVQPTFSEKTMPSETSEVHQ